MTVQLLDPEITTVTVEASLADLEARNATNVVRLDTLPATVPKVVDTAVDTVVVGMGVLGLAVVSKHAIPAVAMVTWPVTALKARNATTVRGAFFASYFSPLVLLKLTSSSYQVAKSVMFHAIAQLKQKASVSAISASSLAMSRPLAPTRARKAKKRFLQYVKTGVIYLGMTEMRFSLS